MSVSISLIHQAETIDQVLGALTETIDWSRATPSRLGYLPALYRRVTVRVKEGIERSLFDDGDRMERQQDAAIAQLDRKVASIAHVIRHPGVVGGTVTRLILLGEHGSISRKIDILT